MAFRARSLRWRADMFFAACLPPEAPIFLKNRVNTCCSVADMFCLSFVSHKLKRPTQPKRNYLFNSVGRFVGPVVANYSLAASAKHRKPLRQINQLNNLMFSLKLYVLAYYSLSISRFSNHCFGGASLHPQE